MMKIASTSRVANRPGAANGERRLHVRWPQVVLLISLSAILATCMSPASAWQQTDPPDNRPSARFDGGTRFRRLSLPATQNQVVGSVSHSIGRHCVTFAWSWRANGPQPEQHSVQVESLAFWPTEVIGAGQSRVLVAGRNRSGHTLIELWELGRVPPLRGWQDENGNWEYPAMHVDIVSRRTVLDEQTTGRGIVGCLLWNPRTPTNAVISMYALFDDSRDLCKIDLNADGTSAVQRVLSGSSNTGVPHVPSLTCDFDSHWSGNHPQSGYVYVLTSKPNEGVPCQTLVLLDRDRNGSLDSDGVLTPDASAWSVLGFSEVSNFLEMY